MSKYQCPKCRRSNFVVQLVAAFAWDGSCLDVTWDAITSSEHPLCDDAAVLCEHCEWVGKVRELETAAE